MLGPIGLDLSSVPNSISLPTCRDYDSRDEEGQS